MVIFSVFIFFSFVTFPFSPILIHLSLSLSRSASIHLLKNVIVLQKQPRVRIRKRGKSIDAKWRRLEREGKRDVGDEGRIRNDQANGGAERVRVTLFNPTPL